MKKTIRSYMMVRLVAILAVTTMFTMCFVGGSFAKYTSSASNSDNATVAKWSFKVGEVDIATTSETFIFNLFDTINDTKDHNDEDDVVDTKIAPGTEGFINLVLKNESEVTAQYTIDYTVTKNGIPVEFSVDDGETWTNDLDDVAATTLASGATAPTITIQWRWVFETYKAVNTAEVRTPEEGIKYYTNETGTYTIADTSGGFVEGTTYYTLEDAADTTLGINQPELTVSAKITATQVD